MTFAKDKISILIPERRLIRILGSIKHMHEEKWIQTFLYLQNKKRYTLFYRKIKENKKKLDSKIKFFDTTTLSPSYNLPSVAEVVGPSCLL